MKLYFATKQNGFLRYLIPQISFNFFFTHLFSLISESLPLNDIPILLWLVVQLYVLGMTCYFTRFYTSLWERCALSSQQKIPFSIRIWVWLQLFSVSRKKSPKCKSGRLIVSQTDICKQKSSHQIMKPWMQ